MRNNGGYHPDDPRGQPVIPRHQQLPKPSPSLSSSSRSSSAYSTPASANCFSDSPHGYPSSSSNPPRDDLFLHQGRSSSSSNPPRDQDPFDWARLERVLESIVDRSITERLSVKDEKEVKKEEPSK